MGPATDGAERAVQNGPGMRALLVLSTLSICGGLLGSGASTLLAARLLPLDASVPPLPTVELPERERPGVRLAMFGPQVEVPRDDDGGGGGDENPCAPSWRLVGAVVDPLRPERSVAALRGPEGSAALRPSQSWSGATLVRLDARRAELELEAGDHCTVVMGEAPVAEATRRPSVDPRVEVQGGQVRVARGLLDEVMRSPLRVIPGPEGGFRVFGVRRASWSGAMGLENGDTVRALDGAPIDSPDDALAAYARLQSGEPVRVTLDRRGATLERTVQLRPE